MKTFAALVKREVLDGKNGYIRVPLILTGITLVLLILSTLGVGNISYSNGVEQEGIHSFSDIMKLAANDDLSEMSPAITLLYWATTALTWVAFPFVIFFSLLGALYEERRDRSILFWKSMPVADWQEVSAKFFTPLILAPVAFLAVVIAAQLFTALYLSIMMMFQGGPVLDLWPVGLMTRSWFAFFAHYLLWMIWAMPILAWLLFVSSFARRMPFLWAILVPIVMIVVESMFLRSHVIANWIGMHLGGWQEAAFGNGDYSIHGPRDVINTILGEVQMDGLTYTLANAQFWLGLVIAAGFIFGAIFMRKRAI